MKPEPDWGLYLVTDRELSGARPVDEIVKAAVRGGVSVVQLREKNCSTLEYINLAKRLKQALSKLRVPLLINDRVDIALASGADGVHVGQNDMPYKDVRQILGSDAIVGLTVETLDQAKEAENLDADYLGVSTIFATPTKTDTLNEWGIAGLKKLRAVSRHKLVAIGGINATNARDIIEAGADGVAVVSAICAAQDPEKASIDLRSIINSARKCF